jgi:hypothetical protein
LVVNSTVAGEVTAYLWGAGGGGGGGPEGNTAGGGYGLRYQGSTATDPFHDVYAYLASGYYVRRVGDLQGNVDVPVNIVGYSVVVNGAEVYRTNGEGAQSPPPDLAVRFEYVGRSYYNIDYDTGLVELVQCFSFSYSAVTPGAAGNGSAGGYSRVTFNVEPGDLIEVGVGQGGGAGQIDPGGSSTTGVTYTGSTATQPFSTGLVPPVPPVVIAPGTSGYYINILEQYNDVGNIVNIYYLGYSVVVNGVEVYMNQVSGGGPDARPPPPTLAQKTTYVGLSYIGGNAGPYGQVSRVQCWSFQYYPSNSGYPTLAGVGGLGYSPKEIFSSRSPPTGAAEVWPVKNSAYNEFTNTYGVWEQDNAVPNFTRTYQVYFPSSTKYLFTLGCDTYGYVYLDDVLVMEGQGYAVSENPVQYVLYVEQGYHNVKMQGQGASLLPAWTTRSPGDVGTVIHPGYNFGNTGSPGLNLLNEYGIWNNPPTVSTTYGGISTTWQSVYFPVTGYYTIQGSSIGCGSSSGTLLIDSTVVMNLVADSGGLLEQKTVLVTAGYHSIYVNATSSPQRGNLIAEVAFVIQLDPGVAGANSMALAIATPGSLNAYSGGAGGRPGAQGISGGGGGGGGATTLFKNGQLIGVAAGGGGGGGAGRLGRVLQCDAPGIGGLNTAYGGVPTGTQGQRYLGDGGGGGGAGGGVQGGLGGATRGNEQTAFGGANGTSLGDYTEASTNVNSVGTESPYWNRYRGTGGLGGSVFTLIPQAGANGYAVLVFKQSGIRVKDEGEWKSPRVIWIKQNNVWIQVDTVWVKNNTGQWNKVLGSNSSSPDFESLYNQMGWTYYPYPEGDQPAPPPPPPDPPPGNYDPGGGSWGVF